jgi:hypothetical protein
MMEEKEDKRQSGINVFKREILSKRMKLEY